ncbi:MAG: sodium-dependent transporter [Hahellaceae bacterium]|nr:sodium-dependent transporter [Hahellaceae bacterium]MCP5168741.1 sodium-dependent transporter [Hahellaceae bacterium]
MQKRVSAQPKQWTSGLTFVMVTSGATIGLANFWKFPYVAASHGGGLFIAAYILCLLLVGVPMMAAEIVFGRATRKSLVGAVSSTISVSHTLPVWKLLPLLSLIAAIAILSLYLVVGGMSLAYIFHFALGDFVSASSDKVAGVLTSLQKDSWISTSWMLLFLVLVASVSSKGIVRGLQRAFRLLMPLFLVLLIGLFWHSYQLDSFLTGFYALFGEGAGLPVSAWFEAISHAFFTLALGMGVMVSLGSYMPESMPITRTVVLIGLVDVLIALLAGLIVFPLLLSKGLTLTSGFGLLFHSLPLALTGFGEEQFVGVVFFVAVSFAAWSSAIAVMEPLVAELSAILWGNRRLATFLVGTVAGSIAWAAILSFEGENSMRFASYSFFSLIDLVISKIVLPVTGVMIAFYVGWIVPRKIIEPGFGVRQPWQFDLWRILLRWVSPVCVISVFLAYWLS